MAHLRITSAFQYCVHSRSILVLNQNWVNQVATRRHSITPYKTVLVLQLWEPHTAPRWIQHTVIPVSVRCILTLTLNIKRSDSTTNFKSRTSPIYKWVRFLDLVSKVDMFMCHWAVPAGTSSKAVPMQKFSAWTLQPVITIPSIIVQGLTAVSEWKGWGRYEQFT